MAIYVKNMCVTTIDIFIFDKVLIKLTSLPPLDFLAKGYAEKMQIALYLGPYAFLSKNKGTFEWQTFYFLSESIFVFFIFGQIRPKITDLIFNCFLYGILFHSKSLPYKSALRNAEKFKGGKLQAPKNLKKPDFFVFWGADNFPPLNFSTFLRALL